MKKNIFITFLLIVVHFCIFPLKSASDYDLEKIACFSLEYYKEHGSLVDNAENLVEKVQRKMDFNRIKVQKKSESKVIINVYDNNRWYLITHEIKMDGQEICYFLNEKLILGRKYDLKGNYLYMFDSRKNYSKDEYPGINLIKEYKK